MMPGNRRFSFTLFASLLCSLMLFSNAFGEKNEVLAEIQFKGASLVEKEAGVWVDGTYVGYVRELKGSKRVFVMPGEHEVVARMDGYKDFTQRIAVNPNQTYLVEVALQRDPRLQFPTTYALVKMAVRPKRAAVFVDGAFTGHANEYEGLGGGLLLSPGKHDIEIALPGYRTFKTEVTLLANQKFKLTTRLAAGNIEQADPRIIAGATSANAGTTSASAGRSDPK